MDAEKDTAPDGSIVSETAETERPSQDEMLDGLADNLQHKTAAVYLASASRPLLGDLPPRAFDRYVTNVLAGSGVPSDPIGRMLVEQLVMSHHAVGGLLLRAAKSDSVEVATAFYGAAARLMAEFRRGAETIQRLRAVAAEPSDQATEAQPKTARPESKQAA